MRPTFEKTVDLLVKAYLNDTLQHGNCTACAVGNIIADACGYKYVKLKSKITKITRIRWKDNVRPRWFFNGAGVVKSDQTIATGYNVDELDKIEMAFESVEWDIDEDKYMFNGLMSVIDALATIHGIDLKQREEAKLLFVKP